MMGDFNGIVFLEVLGEQLDEVALTASSGAAVKGLPWAGRRRGVPLRGRVILSRRRPVILVALAILAAFAGIALSQDSMRAEIRELLGLVPERKAIMLTGVATDPRGGLWAVGQSMEGRTIVTYRAEEEWRRLPDLDFKHGVGQVAPVSPDDVWAMVGVDFAAGRIAHWDGSAWTDVTYPAAQNDEFWDAVALAPDDAWLVGSRPGRPFHEVGDEPGELTIGRRPFAWHWDGSAWRTTNVPPVGGRTGQLSAVFGAAGEVWATGRVERLVGTATPEWFADGQMPMPVTRDEPILLRWDGARWRRVAVPNTGEGGSGIAGLSVLENGEVYVAVNSQLTADDAREQKHAASVLYLDDGRWRVVGGPPAGRLEGWSASALAVASTGEVWLMADSETGDRSTLHWDGESWAESRPRTPAGRVEAPMIGTGSASLVVAASDEVWLFGGWTSLAGGTQQVWRWDGERWSWVETKL